MLGGHVTSETRCCIANVPADARNQSRSVHSHCSVENYMHWVLDMAFWEDERRMRTGYTTHHMTIPRCLAPACRAARPLREASWPSASRPAGWDNGFPSGSLAI